MARIESYRDLEVWQQAMVLVELCYHLTEGTAPAERFGLAAHLRRTAVSIPSNIAEGHNRRSRDAYRHHVAIALGSQAELETQLELGRRLRLLDENDVATALETAARVGRMLHRLVVALERPPSSD